ncbi:M23 family metallopeptidase [Curtobacterium sp. DN_7.5]|uniref:M23 family metallopeptidase n=1 Tax=Curtobacterium sp. DN_7.5 TaxID=3049047 RepID=UPI001F570AA8|nr:M23 family metallopeptidase [Curtobacterium sp. DN_7.5]
MSNPTELPTRRSRRTTDRGRTPEPTGAAVSPPAASVLHPELPTRRDDRSTVLPTRRSLRAAEHDARRRDRVRALTEAVTVPLRVVTVPLRVVTVPLRVVTGTVSSTRAVPVTATAVAACMVVALGSPQSALAATPQVVTPGVGAVGQQYVAPDGSTVVGHRDTFGVALVRPVPEPTRATAAARPATPRPAASGVVRPVVGTVPVAGGFGGRQVVGCGACSTDHQGLDFAAAEGTPVVAVLPGRVLAAGVLGGYGNQVLVQHADGTQTRSAHLSRIDVVPGQTVAAGQQLGAVGSTGVSTGPHLHFEVLVDSVPVDPAAWLAARGIR